MDQPRRFRASSWISGGYFLLALIILVITVSASMDAIHGTGGFSPHAFLVICLVGLVAGLAGLAVTATYTRRSNSNARAALFAFLFGAIVFGLGALAARHHLVSNNAVLDRPTTD